MIVDHNGCSGGLRILPQYRFPEAYFNPFTAAPFRAVALRAVITAVGVRVSWRSRTLQVNGRWPSSSFELAER